MGKPCGGADILRKQRIRHLGFLQAENIWPQRRDEAVQQGLAQAQRVDIPSGDGERHGEIQPPEGIGDVAGVN
jgi:hypothetical protein